MRHLSYTPNTSYGPSPLAGIIIKPLTPYPRYPALCRQVTSYPWSSAYGGNKQALHNQRPATDGDDDGHGDGDEDRAGDEDGRVGMRLEMGMGTGAGDGDADQPEDSRCTQEGPSGIQEEPKRSQETPLRTRAASKDAQVAPKSHPRGT